ncbi:hypothetical protein [Lactobacillus acetotolerans]|uniref:Uncharacterized protein n=1 Tax=Lactobacillus acetotolerans TaxID=1600 RepID=A0A5P5ZGY9_9LACO|nr:hypothetical protein [Lactobacillus acetotolerans]KRN40551.1 hypothetical protein FC77_GL000624 [Lactobacillus acetotolerans DSM 20749 = JCM 3825]QFG50744.1 hypothetical protein LA749_01305 [Lactobacillus acetotolerans]GGV14294.1 hypothetical protein GCM10011628_09770 [Lactobacillus acetotolerans DSM 20749 = JCM 3825]
MLKKINKKGYKVQVSYDMTRFMSADINLAEIEKANQETDLTFKNPVLNSEDYDYGSASFDVFNTENEPVAQELTFEQLKTWIKKNK